MFEPTDNIPEFGSIPVRRGGGWGLLRVARMGYRRTMISFAKYILIEFDVMADGDLIEKAVDAWLNHAPVM